MEISKSCSRYPYEFTKSAKASSEGTAYATHVLVLAKFHTKLFKDSNFNILKAAIELFVAICDLYESLNVPLGNWMCQDAAFICVSKISDKKFASLAPMLLSRLCELQLPKLYSICRFLFLNQLNHPCPTKVCSFGQRSFVMNLASRRSVKV